MMLQRFINKINKTITLRQREKIRHKELARAVEKEKHTLSKTIIKVLQFCIENPQWAAAEGQALAKINQLRTQMEKSNKIIESNDFGSGTPTSKRKAHHQGHYQTLSVGNICKIAATRPQFGELIFKLIRELQPENCLELGTSIGISGIYQVSALQLNQKGRFTTIEGAKAIAEIANTNIQKLSYPHFHVIHGKFNEVLSKILKKEEAFDFVFIDGHHDKDATKHYYEIIYPYLKENAVVIFDDIHWSKGMAAFWKNFVTDGEGVVCCFDLYQWGICVIDKDKKTNHRNHYTMTL